MSKQLLHTFYQAFSEGDAKAMRARYHTNIQFTDPAFGALKGEEVSRMWEMLLSKKSAELRISFTVVEADEKSGTVDWTAEYFFGPKKRKVINHVHSKFVISNGLILEQVDAFDIWKWSSQALGMPGKLLGWTSFLQQKIQARSKRTLQQFIDKNSKE